MGRKTTEIPFAAVSRLAHVKDDIRVQKEAIEFVGGLAEQYITEVFTGAFKFTEHRGGTMIMRKDIDAYLNSLQ